MSHRAHMIGAGIGNLAAAVYLIRDGQWDGSNITIYGLETHGANDGQPVAEFAGEYGHSALKNSQGFLNRGGRRPAGDHRRGGGRCRLRHERQHHRQHVPW